MQDNIFLIGFMGSGKTTVGRRLAKALDYAFKDSDREIEQRCGADIPWIFDVEGEKGFRDRESRVLKEIARERAVVLATGGGAVLRPENRALLQKNGCVVYLKASPEQVLARTAKDSRRPLLQNQNPMQVIQKLLAEREKLYREIAELTVNTDHKKPIDVVQSILQLHCAKH